MCRRLTSGLLAGQCALPEGAPLHSHPSPAPLSSCCGAAQRVYMQLASSVAATKRAGAFENEGGGRGALGCLQDCSSAKINHSRIRDTHISEMRTGGSMGGATGQGRARRSRRDWASGPTRQACGLTGTTTHLPERRRRRIDIYLWRVELRAARIAARVLSQPLTSLAVASIVYYGTGRTRRQAWRHCRPIRFHSAPNVTNGAAAVAPAALVSPVHPSTHHSHHRVLVLGHVIRRCRCLPCHLRRTDARPPTPRRSR